MRLLVRESYRRGMRRRPIVPVLLIGATTIAATMLTSCSIFGTADDERLAKDIAEQQFPGQLELIDARNLWPAQGGSEITFAIVGDADAVVRFRIDSDEADGSGRCDGTTCAAALTEKVTRARERASETRALLDSFEACGYPVVGLDEQATMPWVAASVTNENVTTVLAELTSCADQWRETAAERGIVLAPDRTRLGVNIVDPDSAAKLPDADSDLPSLIRLSFGDRTAALTRDAYLSASVPVTVGEPVASMRIVMPFDQGQEYESRVIPNVEKWLIANNLDLGISQAGMLGVTALEPGTVDRIQGYVVVCDPPPQGKRCIGDHAVGVVTDLDGNPTGEFTLYRDLRDGTGVLRLPTG